MKLYILGSSSKGNGYILQASTGASLIIECGMPLMIAKKALDWKLSGVAAALVSHIHGDHAGYVQEYSRAGIRVLAPEEVIVKHPQMPFAGLLRVNRSYLIGDYTLRTIPMQHANSDGTPCECFGYIIEHPEMGRTLFATDTIALPFPIKGLHHVMIEANYDDDILQSNIDAGIVAGYERDRLRLSHMEIKTVERMIQTIDMSEVVEVILLHLSERNADRKAFIRRIESASGKTCIAATPGTIDFNKLPY